MSLKDKLLNIMDKELNKMQEIIDKEYEEKGLTKDVLKYQLFINKRRNKYDLTDKSELIYEDFVQ